ncbi:hypothetical protein ACFV4N_10045 [Actinosynnema sp. NPDC059797]
MPVPVHLHEVLDDLALNPALPADLVRRMSRYPGGRGDVAQRPDLTDDVIAEIIEADRFRLVHSLALNRGLPDAFRVRLARHPDPGVRAAVVIGSGDGTSREVFELLADDPDPEVRKHLAENDHVPGDLRAARATDPDPEVRATVARWWTGAPERVRRALLTDPDPEVRAAACSTYYARLPHPVPPADLVPALLADPVTRAGAVRHAALDDDTAALLARDPDFEVRRQVAAHPGLPPRLRDVLADDPSALVRVVVFGRADTPEPLRAAIHAGIQDGPGLPDALPVADDQELDRGLDNHLARIELDQMRPDWVTADPLPHVDSPYPCFRAAAAASAALPPEVVARLLDDEENAVRTTAARHSPHLVDLATAERVDRRFRPRKRAPRRPADDFAFPPETLRRFAADPDPRMRCLAPRDPGLPAALAEELAADPDDSVRRAVAGHPNLPTPALVGLLCDESEQVARAAGGSPHLPVERMEWLLALADL